VGARVGASRWGEAGGGKKVGGKKVEGKKVGGKKVGGKKVGARKWGQAGEDEQVETSHLKINFWANSSFRAIAQISGIPRWAI
jgi:hypothetical protein